MSIPTHRERVRILDALYSSARDCWPLSGRAVRDAKRVFEPLDGDEDAFVRLIDHLTAIEQSKELRQHPEFAEQILELFRASRGALTGKVDPQVFWEQAYALNGLR